MAGHFLVPTSQSPSLTVLESLCFEQVSFWVGVVERNRGASGALVNGVPYTRLPAGELVANLTERLPFLSLTVRQVRRALNRLVELGLLVREQFWQTRWRSDYWYTVPAVACSGTEPPETQVGTEVSVSVTALNHAGSECCDQGGHPFLKPLSSSLPNQNQAEGPSVVEQSNPLPLTPTAPPLQGSVQTAAAPLPPVPTAPPLQGRTVPSGVPQAPVPGPFQSVQQRILALAARFDPASLAPVSPSAVVLNGKVHRVDDGPCAPLR